MHSGQEAEWSSVTQELRSAEFLPALVCVVLSHQVAFLLSLPDSLA